MTVAPYGSWTTPISAADLAASGHPVGGGRFVGEEIWWTESRPDQGGRQAVRRRDADGNVTDVLPAPWNARSRVHEYGGSSWTARADGSLVFAEFSDQRLYLLSPGASEPAPLTPANGDRYADPRIVGAEVWCVRESHDAAGNITRDICAVGLDGSAPVRSVVGGSDFLANPRISPDGSKLAWIAWDHPQMPWDGTELRVAELVDGCCTGWRRVLGSPEESVLQPEWADDHSLYAISDRSGWWNLYQVPLSGEPRALHPMAADFGGAMWLLGARWYALLDDGKLLTVRTFGRNALAILDPASGELADVDLVDVGLISLTEVSGGKALLSCAGDRRPAGVRQLELREGILTDVRLGVDTWPDNRYLPEAELRTFDGPGGRPVHAILYRPANDDFTAPDGELPPYVVTVHGGPTDHAVPALNPSIAYFTSRGIGVLDVNYGGSTGYGRTYRNRLRGQWGVVDVEDTVAAVRGLVAAGLADPARIAISGGSAGGFTVLAALTSTDVFACGASYYGIADLTKLLEHTHDFESQYPLGLIGPYPSPAYTERSPLSHVDELSCPVLLLQGLLDPVVPPEQAELFRDAMLAKGIAHAYLAFPDESHGFRQAANQIAAREAELSFYGQVMGFQPPGVPVLPLWRPVEPAGPAAD
ncbi:MAG TPA: prolyl oligopeptidase family serine peptidase [Jatrophihabitans sp.]|nr:prolyl oligopeptidase family serine peptidase [Jatrophihabitans sp.]